MMIATTPPTTPPATAATGKALGDGAFEGDESSGDAIGPRLVVVDDGELMGGGKFDVDVDEGGT